MKVKHVYLASAVLLLTLSCQFTESNEPTLTEYVEKGDFNKASEIILKSDKDEINEMDIVKAARFFSEKVNYTKSNQILEKLAEKNPESFTGRLLLANNLRFTREDDNKAMAIYDELATIDSVRFIVLPERARMYILLNETDKARADIDEAKGLQPKYFAVFLAEGLLYYSQGELEQALDQFEVAENLDPGVSAEASLYAGYILLKSNLNYDALGKFTKAIDVRKNINVAYAFINRGVCQINLQDTMFACRDWDSASHYLPEQAKTYIEKYCLPVNELPVNR